jgi:hypothetical protein
MTGTVNAVDADNTRRHSRPTTQTKWSAIKPNDMCRHRSSQVLAVAGGVGSDQVVVWQQLNLEQF